MTILTDHRACRYCLNRIPSYRTEQGRLHEWPGGMVVSCEEVK